MTRNLPCPGCGAPVVGTPDELCFHCEGAQEADARFIREELANPFVPAPAFLAARVLHRQLGDQYDDPEDVKVFQSYDDPEDEAHWKSVMDEEIARRMGPDLPHHHDEY